MCCWFERPSCCTNAAATASKSAGAECPTVANAHTRLESVCGAKLSLLPRYFSATPLSPRSSSTAAAATASKSAGAAWSRVANAHVVLARCCGPKSRIRATAAAAASSKRGGAACPAVANAHTVLEMPCASKPRSRLPTAACAATRKSSSPARKPSTAAPWTMFESACAALSGSNSTDRRRSRASTSPLAATHSRGASRSCWPSLFQMLPIARSCIWSPHASKKRSISSLGAAVIASVRPPGLRQPRPDALTRNARASGSSGVRWRKRQPSPLAQPDGPLRRNGKQMPCLTGGGGPSRRGATRRSSSHGGERRRGGGQDRRSSAVGCAGEAAAAGRRSGSGAAGSAGGGSAARRARTAAAAARASSAPRQRAPPTGAPRGGGLRRSLAPVVAPSGLARRAAEKVAVQLVVARAPRRVGPARIGRSAMVLKTRASRRVRRPCSCTRDARRNFFSSSAHDEMGSCPPSPSPPLDDDEADDYRLHEVWLHDFKSYAGAVRVGPTIQAHADSSMVGPNRRGKSPSVSSAQLASRRSPTILKPT